MLFLVPGRLLLAPRVARFPSLLLPQLPLHRRYRPPHLLLFLVLLSDKHTRSKTKTQASWSRFVTMSFNLFKCTPARKGDSGRASGWAEVRQITRHAVSGTTARECDARPADDADAKAGAAGGVPQDSLEDQQPAFTRRECRPGRQCQSDDRLRHKIRQQDPKNRHPPGCPGVGLR